MKYKHNIDDKNYTSNYTPPSLTMNKVFIGFAIL